MAAMRLSRSPQIISPERADKDGCPVLFRPRVLTARHRVPASVRWPLLGQNDEPVDLSDCVDIAQSSLSLSLTEGTFFVAIKANFLDGCGATSTPVVGSIQSAAEGIVTFDLPQEVIDAPGTYVVDVNVEDADNRILLRDQALLSVERGVGFEALGSELGQLTIGEIRAALRDFAGENTLLDAVEFSLEDILYAIRRPIRDWNETPPPIEEYSPCDFPWHEHWLQGTIAYLLDAAVHHYTRNKLAGGGLMAADKARDQEYAALAARYMAAWKAWMMGMKASRNAAKFFGSWG